MSKRRFLYFDLGRVLVDFNHSLMCHQLAEIAGVDVAEVNELIFGDGALMRAIEVGELDQQAYHKRFCEKTHSDVPLASFLHATSDIFTLNTDMIPIVAQLVSANQPIGILSNTCQPHWDHVCDRYAMFPDMFDVVALSYKVGAAKPDRAIYDKAASMAGFRVEDIFFVDDRQENVDGARRAGFTAVQFTSAFEFAAELRKHGFRFNF